MAMTSVEVEELKEVAEIVRGVGREPSEKRGVKVSRQRCWETSLATKTNMKEPVDLDSHEDRTSQRDAFSLQKYRCNVR